MRKLQKGGSSSGLLGWAWRTNYILFERDTSRDETGPKMVCAENKEKLPQRKAIKTTWRKKLANPNLSQDNHNRGRCGPLYFQNSSMTFISQPTEKLFSLKQGSHKQGVITYSSPHSCQNLFGYDTNYSLVLPNE